MTDGGGLVDLVVDLSSRGDRTTALYRALLAAVQSGRVRPGERLPTSRALALDLGVARTTVTTAYERLVAEGFLTARTGAGTFVSVAAPHGPPRRAAAALTARPPWRRAPAPSSGSSAAPLFDFRTGLPDGDLFPHQTWRRLLAGEIRSGAHDLSRYPDPYGHLPLRSAIARHLGRSRGVLITPDDLIVTTGTQQSLDLVVRVLVAPGDVVAVEDPGYPPVRALLETAGARVVGVPVDEAGLVADALPAGATVVFTTPSHQFPYGPAMTLARRRQLLDFAAQHGSAIVEDDYDSEFRFTERPLETLYSLAQSDGTARVLYLGSFSKSLVPGLRIGFLAAPDTLRAPLAAALQLATGFAAVPEQAALARFLADGLYARHLRRARTAYAARREVLLAALEDPLAAQLRLVPAPAGLHLTTELRDPGREDTTIVAQAGQLGLALEALSSYGTAHRRSGLVLGYGAIKPAAISPGLELLGRILAAPARSTTMRPTR